MARRRRSIANWISNWERSELPVLERLRVATRNLSLRVVHRDTCCGHEGEPGCCEVADVGGRPA